MPVDSTPAAHISFEQLPAGWSATFEDSTGEHVLSGPAFEPVSEPFVLRADRRRVFVWGYYLHVADYGEFEESFVKGFTCDAPATGITPASVMSLGRVKVHYR